MKKKSIVTLCFVVLGALLLNYVAFFGLNIANIKYGGLLNEDENIYGGIKKGIDLAGGSVLTFEAIDANPTDDEMRTVETVFSTRLNAAGYTEARISTGEDGKITVEIPEVTDTDEAKNLLGSVAKLTFVDSDGNVFLEGSDVKDAVYQYGQLDQTSAAQPYVSITFNSEAKEKFSEATKAAAAKTDGQNYIDIFLDETRVSHASVNTQIDSESCVISGGFTVEEARTLANQIKSGQLPFELEVATTQTVGAELGENALKNSLIAAAIGILLIMIFMVIMYRVPGLIADISLLIYVGLIGLAMGLFRVNLSLPGIAGIVLSIGMAVDADCIIFERIKEEMKLGKTIKASVDAGFNKAFSAILDSNITTIITCVVLYISGISTVIGFATTLGIGVILSMFTAIVITKFLLKQLVNIGIQNRGLFCSQKKAEEKKKFAITANRWKFVLLPAVIVAVGVVMYFVHGGFNFDVEFIGGSRLQVQLPDGTENSEVESYLENTLGVDVTVQNGEGAGRVIIKTPPIEGELAIVDEEADANESPVFNALKDKYSLEDSALIDNTTASASFGADLQTKALLYTLLAIICILIYIAIRFEWRSAVMAVIALAINVIVMFAVYAFTHIAVNTTFIAAMLTVIGYSINNTIVIFDRIRENMKGRRKNESVAELTDRSTHETMGRTINSTITTLITIVLIFILGASSIRNFSLPLIVGIIIGAYTSIFIASSFWAVWRESEAKQRAIAAQERQNKKK